VCDYLEDLSEISASGVNSNAPGKKVRQFFCTWVCER
jgi:hypothetical protein